MRVFLSFNTEVGNGLPEGHTFGDEHYRRADSRGMVQMKVVGFSGGRWPESVASAETGRHARPSTSPIPAPQAGPKGSSGPSGIAVKKSPRLPSGRFRWVTVAAVTCLRLASAAHGRGGFAWMRQASSQVCARQWLC